MGHLGVTVITVYQSGSVPVDEALPSCKPRWEFLGVTLARCGSKECWESWAAGDTLCTGCGGGTSPQKNYRRW